MNGAHRYQVAIYNGAHRTYHPAAAWPDATAYAQHADPHADYVAIEAWNDLANGLTGGWVTVEVLRGQH